MIEEFFPLVASVGISLLIIFQSDQQSIHILQGKLFRLKGNQDLAVSLYRKHATPVSAASFALGFAAFAIAMIYHTKSNPFYPLPALIGLVLTLLGIWGRLRTFQKADQEISEMFDNSK